MKTLALEHAVWKVRTALGGNIYGMCYPASEAIYHLAGGKEAGLKPMRVSWKTEKRQEYSHWFLLGPGGIIIDVTAGQFTGIPYADAKGCGFLTKKPSKRAREVLAWTEAVA